jgi:pSer/pThr/pTyr-binding forkhead associated (FHA) protein
MPESLLTILKFLLLALVYLFFLRVLRAVWAEVSPRNAATAGAPAPATQARGARDLTMASAGSGKGAPGRLKVVEPQERKGQAFDLGNELTVGRAAGCQVRVDDTYASQLHARIFRKDGQLFVEDLGSTNGTYLNRRGTRNKEKVAGSPIELRNGDRLMIGKTVLEVAK